MYRHIALYCKICKWEIEHLKEYMQPDREVERRKKARLHFKSRLHHGLISWLSHNMVSWFKLVWFDFDTMAWLCHMAWFIHFWHHKAWFHDFVTHRYFLIHPTFSWLCSTESICSNAYSVNLLQQAENQSINQSITLVIVKRSIFGQPPTLPSIFLWYLGW